MCQQPFALLGLVTKKSDGCKKSFKFRLMKEKKKKEKNKILNLLFFKFLFYFFLLNRRKSFCYLYIFFSIFFIMHISQGYDDTDKDVKKMNN